ncbi:glycosyltransferase family 39 protein [uncultured Arthrobacter sp.]|uniref:ArnT family glycosyltransferase n=1 Tax=uncultured Arthrobacter sp. TaxID=114050 RepID=UPI0026337B54|nr:phospholipid carrier-dependent glycosyltransferase [uncultured Arthrobacter sp.]
MTASVTYSDADDTSSPARRVAPAAHRLVTGTAAGLVLVIGAAFATRAIGLVRGFELWLDEMLYARLGQSVSMGQIPNLPDGPFLLHPPGYFLLEGAVIDLFGISGNSMDLVLQLRWLNAVIGALSVGLAFLLVRKVSNPVAAWVIAVVLMVEPFVLRNNSRVFLETLGMAALLGGFLIIVASMDRPPTRFRSLRLLAAGLLLGYAVLTKDVYVLGAVAPVVVATLWRRTLSAGDALVILLAAAIPYIAYLAVLALNGLLGAWIWAKTNGLRRMTGIDQTTGFNQEGAPSLVGRLFDQLTQFGSSYLLLAIGPVAGLVLCFSAVPGRRLVGITAVLFGLFGVYSVAFGTLEEQYGYPVLCAGAVSSAVCAVELVERKQQWRTPVILFSVAFVALTAATGLRTLVTTDNGFVQVRSWMQENLPTDARVSVSNSTGEVAFEDNPRIGVWPSAPLMQENGANYIITQELPTSLGYGYARPEMLEWLKANGDPIFSVTGPTNGATVLWRVDDAILARGAADNVGFPSATFESER